MEQEEKESYVKTYDEDSREPRRIISKFTDKIVAEVVGPYGKEWLKALDLLTNIEEPTKGLLDALTKLLPKPGVNFYPLTVDYSRSVADGIRAGRYDFVRPDITATHFRTERTGIHEVRVELLHLNRSASTGGILCEMKARGLRQADLHELLVFGEKYPEIQREFSVVALGSVWQGRGNVGVPCLDRCGPGRQRALELGWALDDWDSTCRFAAVRK